MKNNVIKIVIFAIIYGIGYYISLQIEASYPMSEESISQNFYVAVYVIKNLYVLFGLAVLAKFININSK